MARLQRFSRGGFEGSCYWRSRDAFRSNPLGIIPFGGAKVKKPKEQIAAESATRARRRVRLLCREIAADHLVTFTTREHANKPGELMARFARFVREYRKACDGAPWLYVAVSEPHPSNPGHWHAHVACRGGVMIHTANRIWWKLCGGRGQGNIDVKRFKTIDGDLGSLALARYISKYVVKNFDAEWRQDDTRRFRAAIIPLDVKRKLIIEANAPELAIRVLLRELRLGRGDLQIFMYRDGSGFWFSCSGDISTTDPPEL